MVYLIIYINNNELVHKMFLHILDLLSQIYGQRDVIFTCIQLQLEKNI